MKMLNFLNSILVLAVIAIALMLSTTAAYADSARLLQGSGLTPIALTAVQSAPVADTDNLILTNSEFLVTMRRQREARTSLVRPLRNVAGNRLGKSSVTAPGRSTSG